MPSDQPFADVISVVQDIETIASDLNPANLGHPLTIMINVIDDVVDALALVDDIQEAWSLISTAWSAIDGAASVLDQFADVVPPAAGVVEVVDGIGGVFTGVDDTITGTFSTIDDVLDEVVPVLRDISEGLKEIRSLINDVETDLPAIVNTLRIFQAMTEIAVAVAPVFEGTEIGQRLQALLKEYDTIKADVEKVAKPLHQAFHDIEQPINVVKDAVDDIKGVVGGAFATIEGDFNWVASEFGKIENDVTSIANHLGPVRWVLGKVKSIEKKILKPIISKIISITHLSELEDAVVGEIKKKLGFEALKQFNGQTSQHSAVKSNKSHTGTQNAGAMRDMFKDFAGSLAAYKRGDKKSALEFAVEGLLDAFTGGKVDLSKMPPQIPQKKPVLNIPDIAATTVPQALSPRRAPALVAPLDFGASAEVLSLAASLSDGNPGDVEAQKALNAAATAVTTALASATAPYAQALSSLNAVLAASQAPALSDVEISALDTIVSAIADTLARVTKLWPTETAALVPYVAQMQTLAGRLSTLAQKEAALADQFQPVSDVVSGAMRDLGAVAHFPASANVVTGIASGGALVLQFLAQLDRLDAQLNNAYATQVASVHQTFQDAAKAEAATFDGTNGIAATADKAVQQLLNAASAAQSLATAYDGFQQWGTPIAASWLPKLREAEKYAKTVDSILDPLSYLLKVGGCTDADNAGTGGPNIKAEAGAVVQSIEKYAKAAIADILKALPDMLEQLTAEALKLDEISSVLTATDVALPGLVPILKNSASQLKNEAGQIAAATVPPKTYQWTNPQTGETFTFSNAFFSQADAKKIMLLVMRMLKDANTNGAAMPDVPPLFPQSEKEAPVPSYQS